MAYFSTVATGRVFNRHQQQLNNPHIIPIHTYGEIDGRLYVDMRLVEGRDLEQVLTEGPLEPTRAVRIIEQVAKALHAAHQIDLVHRDVKPSNILLDNDDFAYLIDFGIARGVDDTRLTSPGSVVGSWAYMSPERLQDGKVDSRTDIYALACVLYECLTGRQTYVGNSAEQQLIAHLMAPPPLPSHADPNLPAGFDAVIRTGMAKDSTHRYSTSLELATAARNAIDTAPNTASITESLATTTAPSSEESESTPTHVAWAGAPPGRTAVRSTDSTSLSNVEVPAVWAQPTQSASPADVIRVAHTATHSRRWVLIATAIVVVIAVGGGVAIWRVAGDRSAAPTVDVSKLDVGHYPTTPHILAGPTTKEEGRALEAFRLAEGLVNPYEIDSTFSHLFFDALVNPELVSAVMDQSGKGVTRPVLEKHGMVSAARIRGQDARGVDDSSGGLDIFLMSFPNKDDAASAAAEIDAADFAVYPENQPVPIPDFPDAKAHFRGGYSGTTATMAINQFVVSLYTFTDVKDEHSQAEAKSSLLAEVRRVQRVLTAEIPLLTNFSSALEGVLTQLDLDPDSMLNRALVAGDPPDVSARYGTLGPRAAVFCADPGPLRENLFEQDGVDKCAITGVGVLLRTKDDEASKSLLPRLFAASEDDLDHDVPAPEGVAGARCYEQKQSIWAKNTNARFLCGLTYDRYMAVVYSDEENDVRQRAAAQYAILENSQ